MSLIATNEPQTQMNHEANQTYEGSIRVCKRDGSLEPLNINKIYKVICDACKNLDYTNPDLIQDKVINGLHDCIETSEIDEMAIQTAAMLISEEPQYSKVAARLLRRAIAESIEKFGIKSFQDSIGTGYKVGLISKRVYEFSLKNMEFIEETLRSIEMAEFEYFGLKTVFDRYLLKHPKERQVIETPEYFLMRVVLGLVESPEEIEELYKLISSFDYLPSTPTLFNSATVRSQMSSCYLLDSPSDSLEGIYQKYMDVALLSKFAGGIGLAYHRVRSRGSLIRGTNGKSNGIVPFLKTLDSSVSAVNQGGKRKGACCVYLETWHADIIDFLNLRENTGDEAQRTHNLNLANWVPDLFMQRVEADGMWSLFDPQDVPELPDTYGDDFEKIYTNAEKMGLYKKQVKARELYAQMMKTLAQTGNGWMTFKDSANKKSNQTGHEGNVIHLSNLCTEILEVTSDDETAVCNLGSINLGRHVVDGKFDFGKLAKSVRTAIKYLDRVIDINFYPIPKAKTSNNRWRPVGLGIMGLQDVFFKLGMPFDTAEARKLSTEIQEEIYFNALTESNELAKQQGPHPSFAETKAAKGILQFDHWNIVPQDKGRWDDLRKSIQQHGLRNSLLLAIAPTATIASISGAYECTEPQVSNLFKRETLSGEFLQVNSYLVTELRKLDLWNESIRTKIKLAEGSIQNIDEIPDNLKKIFRTAWELPMRALIDLAASRGAFLDQSQSLNLFMESPNIGKLSSMYLYTWKSGLKTSYYLRSRPATQISKTTVKSSVTGSAAVSCSLENPEACEACQ